jgi:hypothetical protein
MRERIAACIAGAGLALAPALAWGQAGIGVIPMAPSPGSFTDPMAPIGPLPLAPTLQVPPSPVTQFLPQGLSVTDRTRPEVSPLGIQVGDFFIFPRLEADEFYDDNIFATTTGRIGTFITELQPVIDVRSNLPTNAINFSTGGAFTRYATHTALNSDQGYGDLNGRLDVDNQHYFSADARVSQNALPLGEPEVPGNAATPLVYDEYAATVAFDQYRLRIGYEIAGSFRRDEYNAIPLVGGGLLSQSNLDNNTYEAMIRPYYEFAPGYQGYIRAAYNWSTYDHAEGAVSPTVTVPTLSSNGYRVDVGSRINLTGVTYADVFVGYLDQTYSASQFGSISGVDFGANVTWNPTQLTTVKFVTGRTVEAINSSVLGIFAFNSPGFLATTAGLSVDHELVRDLLLNANVSYTNDAFQNITRTDDIYSIGAGAKYLLTRHFYLGGSYTFSKIDSSGQGAMFPYTANLFMLRLSTQL